EVDGMQSLKKVRVLFRAGHQINRIRARVDYGCAGDANLGDQIAAARIRDTVHRAATRGNQAHLPIDLATVGVNRVQAIVLGGYVNNIVRSAVDGDIRQVQRLGVDVAVHRHG